MTCQLAADRHDVDARVQRRRGQHVADAGRELGQARARLDALRASRPTPPARGSRRRAGRLRSAWPTRPSTSTTDHSPSSRSRERTAARARRRAASRSSRCACARRVADLGAPGALPAARDRRLHDHRVPALRVADAVERRPPTRRAARPSARPARPAPRRSSRYDLCVFHRTSANGFQSADTALDPLRPREELVEMIHVVPRRSEHGHARRRPVDRGIAPVGDVDARSPRASTRRRAAACPGRARAAPRT